MDIEGCKLEVFGREANQHRLEEEEEEEETEESSMTSTNTSKISGNEWIAMVKMGSNVESPSACFRSRSQPKTLDLFPTYSTGLRDI